MKNRRRQRRPRDVFARVAGALIVLGLPLPVARAQNLAFVVSAPSSEPAGPVLRIIEDPALHDRWLLVPDLVHPGGPGHLIRVPAEAQFPARHGPGQVAGPSRSASRQDALERAAAHLRPVIRAGDRLRLEQHTSLTHVQLEAVATESAAAGESFRARLVLGGKVVRAVALEPGHAVFAPPGGGWR